MKIELNQYMGFQFLKALTFFLGGILVFAIIDSRNKYSKEIVTPTLKIECTDNVCDTTYIYKF